jgi:hypothetical protein
MEKENNKNDGIIYQKKCEIKDSFIAQHKMTRPITLMCRFLEVNSSNYYSYQRRKTNKIGGPDHDDIIGWI